LGATSPVIWVAPVTLPPGRLKLETNPSWTGSPPVVKTIGIVAVAAFATRLAGVLVAAITDTWRPNKVINQCSQTIVLAVRPAIFDGYILTVDVPGFPQTLKEGIEHGREALARSTIKKTDHR
jgi:hypothetical protein